MVANDDVLVYIPQSGKHVIRRGMFVFIFIELWWEGIGRFVNICLIVVSHCLNFLFILYLCIKKKSYFPLPVVSRGKHA